jgi:hypothetical protein
LLGTGFEPSDQNLQNQNSSDFCFSLTRITGMNHWCLVKCFLIMTFSRFKMILFNKFEFFRSQCLLSI